MFINRPVPLHDTIPLRESSTIVFTSTACISPIGGRRTNRVPHVGEDGLGRLAEATHAVYLPFTSTVEVGDRITKADGTVGFFEVLGLDQYTDHKRLWTKRVEARI